MKEHQKDMVEGIMACAKGDPCPEGASEAFQKGYAREYELEQRQTAASMQGELHEPE